MRFLLTSDTHGRLGVIDELADRVRASMAQRTASMTWSLPLEETMRPSFSV
jgi:hypothetical protein